MIASITELASPHARDTSQLPSSTHRMMTHTTTFSSPNHETLLNILADLQTNHSDFLRRISTDLHETASLLQHRAQEFENAGCRSRKEAWESTAGLIWKREYSSTSQLDDLTELIGRMDAEMRSSARDIEDGQELRKVLTRMTGHDHGTAYGKLASTEHDSIGRMYKPAVCEARPVYDKLNLSSTDSNHDILHAVYDLAASRLAQSQEHQSVQETQSQGCNTTKKRKFVCLGKEDYDPTDRLRAFIRDQGLAPSNDHDNDETQSSCAEVSFGTSTISVETLDEDNTGLTEDDDSSTQGAEDEPATPLTSKLRDLKRGFLEAALSPDCCDLMSEESATENPMKRDVRQVTRIDVLMAAGKCGAISCVNKKNGRVTRWAKVD